MRNGVAPYINTGGRQIAKPGRCQHQIVGQLTGFGSDIFGDFAAPGVAKILAGSNNTIGTFHSRPGISYRQYTQSELPQIKLTLTDNSQGFDNCVIPHPAAIEVA